MLIHSLPAQPVPKDSRCRDRRSAQPLARGRTQVKPQLSLAAWRQARGIPGGLASVDAVQHVKPQTDPQGQAIRTFGPLLDDLAGDSWWWAGQCYGAGLWRRPRKRGFDEMAGTKTGSPGRAAGLRDDGQLDAVRLAARTGRDLRWRRPMQYCPGGCDGELVALHRSDAVHDQ